MYQALLFVICVLSALCSGKSDPYSVRVDYSVLDANFTSARCFEVERDPNCIRDDTTPIEGCPHALVRDHFGCCFVCPKGERDTCGGYRSKYGRCQKAYKCAHETIAPYLHYWWLMTIQENLQEGKCLPPKPKKACIMKNCCNMRQTKFICGTDGKWYPNTCSRVKANCFRDINATEIRRHNGDPIVHCKNPPPACIKQGHMCTDQYFAGGPRPVLYYSPDLHKCKVTPTSSVKVPQPSSAPTAIKG